MKLPDNLPLDWGRMEWFGNSNNQRPIAFFTDSEFNVRVSVSDFRCPALIKHPCFGQVHPFMSVALGWHNGACRGRAPFNSRTIFLFRSWSSWSDETRADIERIYNELVFVAGRVIGHRPKESEDFLRKLMGLPKH